MSSEQNGAAWLSAKEVKQRYSITTFTLHHWRTVICAALGRKIRTKPSEQNPTHCLYHAGDLAKIAAVPARNGQEGDWLSAQRLESMHAALSQQRVLLWRVQGCPFLAGKKPRAKQLQTHMPGQHGMRKVWHFHKADVDAILKAMAGPSDGGWIGVREVKRRFGIGRQALLNWTTRPCPLLGGKNRRLRSRLEARARGIKRAGANRLYSVEDLEAITHHRDANNSEEWLTATEARRRFGFSSVILHLWRTRGCPRLGGRCIGAAPGLTRLRSNSGSSRMWKIWRYAKSDLEAITGKSAAKKQRGRPENIRTQEIYAFCYDSYITNGRSGAQVVEQARKRYNNDAPKNPQDVALYAKRWAKKNSLPFLRKSRKSLQ